MSVASSFQDAGSSVVPSNSATPSQGTSNMPDVVDSCYLYRTKLPKIGKSHMSMAGSSITPSVLNPQVNTTLSLEDIWQIKMLPANWTPNTAKSPVIERFLKSRKERHEKWYLSMVTKLDQVNEYTSVGVRLRSEEIKAEIAEIRSKAIALFDTLKYDDPLTVNRKIFKEIIESSKGLYGRCTEKIDEYNLCLKRVERYRTDAIKQIFKETYTEMYKISHLSPYELQTFIEHEILKINQDVLTNFRVYEEICLKLKLQTETDCRKFLENVEYMKRQWKQAKKRRCLDHLKITNLQSQKPDTERHFLESHVGSEVINSFGAKENELEQIVKRFAGRERYSDDTQIGSYQSNNDTAKPPTPYSAAEIESWTTELQDTIESLDTCARDMVNLYKDAMVQVFNGYYDELEHLRTDMIKEEKEDESMEGSNQINVEDDLTSNFYQPLVNSTKKEYDSDIIELENLWNMVIDRLQNNLQNTYVFVHDSGHLWDEHFIRVEDAQRLVRKHISKVTADNDRACQDREVRLNCCLDKMRQETLENDLNNTHEEVISILDDLKNGFTEHFNVEKEAAEKYTELIEIEVEVLVAEINHFLQRYPRKGLNIPMDPVKYSIFLRNKTIPKQMRRCEYQVTAVANWKIGLWDAIERYGNICQEELIKQANSWVNERIDEITKRLDVKLALHTPRYKRIELDIFEVRLMEIQSHTDRMERHELALINFMEEFFTNVKQISTANKGLFVDVERNLQTVQEKIVKQIKVSNLNFYKHALEKLDIDAATCIRDLLTGVISELENKIGWAKDSNCNYLTTIKMFSEGGNYSATEAQTYQAALVKLESALDKMAKKIYKEIQKQESILQKQIVVKINKASNILVFTTADVKFIETSIEIIKQLQHKLKVGAFNLKFSLKQISSQTADTEIFLDERYDAASRGSRISQLAPRIDTLIGEMIVLDGILQQPDKMFEMKPIPRTKYDECMRASRASSKSSKGSKSGKTTAKSDTSTKGKRGKCKKKAFKPTDYRDVLFGGIPASTEAYISRMCLSIYESFLELQFLAMRFYNDKRNKPILKKDLIHQEYDFFMEEILYKFKYYHIQCEEVWLDTVQGFVALISSLKETLLKYSDMYTAEYNRLKIDQLDEIKMNYRTFIHKHKHDMQIKWDEIHDKLKPLHGYPRNQTILNELCAEVENTLDGVNDVLHEETSTFQETINSLEEIYTVQMSHICETLQTLIKTICSEQITTNLINQLYNRLRLENIPVEATKKISGSKTSGWNKSKSRSKSKSSRSVDGDDSEGGSKGRKKRKDKPESSRVKSSRSEFAERINIPKDCRLSVGLLPVRLPLPPKKMTPVEHEMECVQKMSSRIEKQPSLLEYHQKLIDTIQDVDEQKIASAETLDQYNINVIAQTYTRNFQEKVYITKEELEKELSIIKELPEKWRVIWHADVEKVINLYSVKYE